MSRGDPPGRYRAAGAGRESSGGGPRGLSQIAPRSPTLQCALHVMAAMMNFLTWCWASKVSRCLRCGCCERRGHTTVPPQLTPQRRTSARRKVAHLRDRAPFQSLNHRWASKELASLVLFIDDRSLARSILIAFSAMKSNPAFILHCMPDESSPEILV